MRFLSVPFPAVSLLLFACALPLPAPGADDLVAVARTVPMLSVNLNNFKYHENPIFRPGPPGAWDERAITRVVVFRAARDDWRMWYGAQDRHGHMRIGLATSPDGISWTRHSAAPVLEPTETWEGTRLAPTCVARIDGTFYLYYWAPGHFPDRTTLKRIGLAVSADGVTWTKKGVVLDLEPAIHDESPERGGTGVDAAKVFYLGEQRKWAMLFTGFGPHGQWNGLAESHDAIAWTKVRAPIAPTPGAQNRANRDHRENGQTIRCPVRVGAIWAALDFQTDGSGAAPSAAWSLDRWVTLGPRTFYRNQDYERGGVAPVALEAAEEWFYLYYMIYGEGTVALIRAPRRSIEQPMVLWSDSAISGAGAASHVIETGTTPPVLHVTSDRAADVRVLVRNPSSGAWLEQAAVELGAGRLASPALPGGATVRLRVVPREGGATVSAWAVISQPLF